MSLPSVVQGVIRRAFGPGNSVTLAAGATHIFDLRREFNAGVPASNPVPHHYDGITHVQGYAWDGIDIRVNGEPSDLIRVRSFGMKELRLALADPELDYRDITAADITASNLQAEPSDQFIKACEAWPLRPDMSDFFLLAVLAGPDNAGDVEVVVSWAY